MPSPATSDSPSATDQEVLVKVEGVSKKFCRSLKKSLWYGVCDIACELSPLGKRPRIAEVAGNESLVTSQNQSASGGSILPATSDSPLATSDGLRPDEFYAVRDVSFELKRGECLGLIGHNGAGKTTLLKMLNGLIKPDAGRITMRGRVGALIALGAGFNPILTGRENIYINGSVLGLGRRQIDARLDEIIDFAGIGDFIDAPVQSYSSGMGVRLGFAVASTLDPDVMLLDEVLAVGDMEFQAKCLNKLGRMRAQGASFILVSHNMLNITRYCDRVLFMEKGREKFLGSTPEGIRLYERDATLGIMEADEPENVVTGTERAKITNAFFTSLGDRKCETIRSGEGFRLWIEYRQQTPLPLPVRVEITIRDRESILHQHSPVDAFIADGGDGGQGCFQCDFPSIPSNSALLLCSITLWNVDHSELYDWKKGFRLNVVPAPRSTGRIHLDYTVRHFSGPARAGAAS